MLAGKKGVAIAADLGISEKTVEEHRARILRKTGCACVAELMRFAIWMQLATLA
jgi:two-component system CheB/CheR fusion protein